MGARRVTPQEIAQMQQLYAQIGSYAAVGRVMGRSGTTVAKYVKMGAIPASLTITVQNVVIKS